MRKNLFTVTLLLGLLLALSGCGQAKTLQETIPTLTLQVGDQSVDIPSFGYSWDFKAAGQSAVADTAHPLQVVDDLTKVSMSSGSAIAMDFSRLPDSVTITCWSADQAGNPGADGQNLESDFSNGQFHFTPPESDQDLVLQVRGSWTSYSDVSGSVGYVFVLSQS